MHRLTSDPSFSVQFGALSFSYHLCCVAHEQDKHHSLFMYALIPDAMDLSSNTKLPSSLYFERSVYALIDRCAYRTAGVSPKRCCFLLDLFLYGFEKAFVHFMFHNAPLFSILYIYTDINIHTYTHKYIQCMSRVQKVYDSNLTQCPD